jgi:Mce-associated membrane protein
MKVTLKLPTILLLLAVVSVAFVGVPQWRHLDAAQQRADDRADAIAVAKLEVAELTTLSPSTLDTQLKQLRGRLTGAFARQFEAFYATFASVVKKERVASRGSVQSVALASLTEHKAVALVAARAVVTSKGQKSNLDRAYRFEVSLSKHGSLWLISGMRFVS